MKNSFLIFVLLLSSTYIFSQYHVNFDLVKVDTARVTNFHPDCNGVSNGGVWETENLVVMVSDMYPSAENEEIMTFITSYHDALFLGYYELTGSETLYPGGGFGEYHGKPVYHISNNMCPGYSGGAHHGVTGNVVAKGYLENDIKSIQSGDTAFNQVHTYEMHRNFWSQGEKWNKIGWYMNNDPADYGHWTTAMNVQNGIIMTKHLGVGVFEDAPINNWDLFYEKQTEGFKYYLANKEWSFENVWTKGAFPDGWEAVIERGNTLMSGIVQYGYDNFGGFDWVKKLYRWVHADTVGFNDFDYSNYPQYQNIKDNFFRIWSMSSNSMLLNFFESELRWDITPDAINWVAEKLDVSIVEPSALKAIPVTNSQVKLSWNDNSDNETGFILERKELTGDTFVELQTLNTNTNTYTDDVSGEYVYRVKAFNDTDETVYTTEANVNTAILLPSAPTIIETSPVSSSSIKVKWELSEGETIDGVEIVLANNNSNVIISVIKKGNSSGSLTVRTLNMLNEYTCKVRAYNQSGFSEFSAGVVESTMDVAPVAPSARPPENLTSTSVNIIWRDKSDNEDGFTVRRKKEGSSYKTIATIEEPNVEKYQDTGLTPNTTYYYQIAAFNESGKSGLSKEIPVTTSSTGIDNTLINGEHLFIAYPNPITDVLTIEFNTETQTEKEIRLIGIDGKEYFRDKTILNKYTLNSTELHKGVYFIEVKIPNEQATFTKKIIFKN